ncbi:Protein tyrosine/serine phosphatase [Modestobacter sp. DSM 44400]|uniref:tyrosine-protein phosphatase n=1 Tax=Modestobacter sp. DSM 44400 TaxID=1550230 RepID=UPI00089B2B4A|nr:tyrosine-protein phosphatase [Modestobacter sp. DSM 44400]SDY45101.1 Protein tyrosine/serine phosphatase [Modestobacter sp. DSM 44400]
MTVTRTDRWIALEGTTNTRDLGGLPTRDGGRTQYGRVLRSANLQTLTPGDVHRLVDELGLQDVIDLRTTAEVLLEGRGPLRAVPTVTHRHFTLLPERGQRTDVFAVEEDDEQVRAGLPADWAESVLPRATAPGAEDEPPAVRSYLGYLVDGADNVLAALRALAAGGPGAAVVHCAAGKDRTGVVCALALAVADVETDAIVADYAQSAEAIDAVVALLAASPTYAEDMARRDAASHTPRAESMRRVMEVLEEQHGGGVGWLTEHGFGANEQAALKARLRN